MASITEHRRVARCECGACLVGDTEQELYEAAQLHLARHHPQLLGALGLEVVAQMAEDVGGMAPRAPGRTSPRAGGEQTVARPGAT